VIGAMNSFNTKAEKILARKYGSQADEWMRNWGTIRNRLEQRIFDSYNRRMHILAAVVPALLGSIAVPVLTTFVRGF